MSNIENEHPAALPALWIERKPYWLTEEGVRKIEKLKGAYFMGHWCTKSPQGFWNESPVDVFYVSCPDVSRGHTNYFGMFSRDGHLYICEASTAFLEPITGVVADDGEVIASRYRHDFQQRKGVMIDGGRDYIRSSGMCRMVSVRVNGSEFDFSPIRMPELGSPKQVSPAKVPRRAKKIGRR